MKSKYLLEKNKYNTDNTNKINKFNSKYDYIQPKNDSKDSSISSQFKNQKYPTGADNSRNGGHIINLGNEIGGNEEVINEKENNSKISDDNGANITESINEYNDIKNIYLDLISQRCIELQIYKGKFDYFLIGAKNLDDKNNKLNSNKYNNEIESSNIKNRLLSKNISNKDINNNVINVNTVDNSFNSLIKNQFPEGKKSLKIDDIKIKNKPAAYIRKINIDQRNNKENGTSTSRNSFYSARKINTKKIIILNDIKRSRNFKDKKAETLNSLPETSFEKFNKIKKKITLQKNNSLFDLFPKNKINETESLLNNSLKVKDNIYSFYKSLDYFKNNMDEDLNNSKIMKKSFLAGIKNEDRKNSLNNSITIYNRFKSFGKYKKINLYTSPLMSKINKEMNENINDNYNNKNYNEDNNNETNNYYEDDINIKKEKKKESNIDEDDNQNEFSFNSKYRKKEKSREENNIEEMNSENNNYNNESMSILNPKIINKVNNNINDEKNQKEEYIKQEENNFVEKDNVKEEINEEKIGEYNKILNKSLDNVNNGIDKLIIKNNESSINNFSGSDTDNDIINKTEHLMKYNTKNKNKNLSKPNYFVRKVIREEHYYIDENGKEKLLEVKQRLINDENKNKKSRRLYIKKNFNAKSPMSKRFNKNEYNKNKNSYVYNYSEKNPDINDKDIISNKFEKINKNKKKINLTYYHKSINNQDNLEKGKNELELRESNFTQILPDSILQNSNDLFKDFNEFFFKKDINSLSCINKKKNYYESLKKSENNIIYQKNLNESVNKNDNIKSRNNKELKSKKEKFKIKKEMPVIIMNNKYYENPSRVEKSRTGLRKRSPNVQNNNNNYINEKDIFVKENDINENIKDISMTPTLTDEKDIENETEDKNNMTETDSYIKVKKMKKFKKLNIEEILAATKNKKFHKRDFHKNHAFHEIKTTKNSNFKNRKNRLSYNSQFDNYASDAPTDELNKSQRANIYTVNTLRSEINNGENLENLKVFDIKKNDLRQKNFSIKSNSESFYTINTRYSYKNKNNIVKKHHKFFESKSSKNKIKDSDNESEGNNYNYSNFEKFSSSNVYKKDSKDKYFYQNYRENVINLPYQYNVYSNE